MNIKKFVLTAEPMTVQDKEVGTQINDKMPSIEQEKAKEAEKKEVRQL